MAKLDTEQAGILRWIVEGCCRWQRHGLSDPVAVQMATSNYRLSQDLVGEFLAENVVTGAETMVSAARLYAAYCNWCEGAGERAVSQRALGQKLTERGYDRVKHGPERRWHWLGVGLLQSAGVNP